MKLEFGNPKHIGYNQKNLFDFLIDSADDLERDTILAEKKQLDALLAKMKRGEILSGPERKTYEALSEKFLKKVEQNFGDRVTTYQQIADHFGMHVQTVKNWAAKGMPKLGRNNYSLTDIKKWATGQGLIVPDEQSDDQNLEDLGESYAQKYQRERYFHEKAKRKERELKVKELLGILVNVQDVSKEVKEMARAIKTELSAIPQKISPFLEGLGAIEIQKQLTEAIDDAFRHLHKSGS